MKYSEARPQMRQGDLIAFSGIGPFSTLIKAVTFSDISHVGVILQSQVTYCDETINQIIESTSLGDGFVGVQINRMSQRVQEYNGGVYWYPLRDDVYANLDIETFSKFLLAQDGKSYDKIQAVFSALDLMPDTKEDFSKLFCSEIVTGSYKHGKIISWTINASEQTPVDVCNFDKYKKRHKLSWE
jgi:hypothetical protein